MILKSWSASTPCPSVYKFDQWTTKFCVRRIAQALEKILCTLDSVQVILPLIDIYKLVYKGLYNCLTAQDEA